MLEEPVSPEANIAKARLLFDKLKTVEYKTAFDAEDFNPTEIKDRILSLLISAGVTVRALDPTGTKGDKEMEFQLNGAYGRAMGQLQDKGVTFR